MERLTGTSLDDEKNENASKSKEDHNRIPPASEMNQACCAPPSLSSNQSATPPAPPPPSLPAPPLPPKFQAQSQDKNSRTEISKWDPREISWMKKDLM